MSLVILYRPQTGKIINVLGGKFSHQQEIDIISDTEIGNEKWLELNKKYSEIWPNITERKDPPKDSKEHENEENKFEKYFKENI